ncbi:SDR family NAD(P)-dependent oxidoreductase [Emticicia sp. CRIBPO]|uniref:SDR family NAD(P)-dependent oxidoreductase n=1 Tax=Emticicia sp. CRIBPO TaxID=2683258 RepID=UPI001413408D|nr:SDR family NAD(P)-dependent oxidoreductase [Emticicia sp. CRIBPO]NBA86815.1 SDR family NAD(P)-dependent oxidoreductase [Emticicia sp. CRIBPO]
MKVLITGANGLVGSAVAKQFLQEGHDVYCLCRPSADLSFIHEILNKISIIEGDVLDVLSVQKAFEGMDLIVHAAAVVSFAPKDREMMYKVNVEGTANVVNTCVDLKIKKLCFVSSIAALGRPSQTSATDAVKVNENQKWEDSPLNSHYAISKYQAECEVWRGEAEGLDVVIVNPVIILGEGNWLKSSTQLFKYVYDQKPFYTEGFINYVDIKDLSDIIVKLSTGNVAGERYVVSAGTMSYKDFFFKIADSFKKKRPTIKVKPWMMEMIWRVEIVRSWLTGKAPLITKETAKTAKTKFIYENNKIKNALKMEFTGIDQTIERVCKYLVSKS